MKHFSSVCRIFAFAVLSLLLSQPASSRAAETGAFTGDFESGDLSQWDGKEAARADSVAVVTGPVRSGRYAARFTVRPGERVSNGNRAEIFTDPGHQAGSEVWYAWSFLIPDDFVDTEWRPKLWQCIGQWHDQPDKSLGETWANFPGRSPSIAVYYTSKNGKSAIEFWAGTYGKDENQTIVARAPIVKGEWQDVMFHIRWSQGADGFVEPFLNGKPVIAPDEKEHRAYGANMWNAASHYLKIGLYRTSEITTTNSVYFDEVRMINPRALVAPPAVQP